MSVAKLSLVVHSGDFDRVYYALALAAGAAASNTPCTLFFTMTASHALLADQGWHRLAGQPDAAAQDAALQAKALAGFEELLEACAALGVTFMICEMGLRALDLQSLPLRRDIDITPGGIVTFLADASPSGGMMMI